MIIKTVNMILSDVENNNNKQWIGTLTDNNEVILEWGRVGDSVQKKVKTFDSLHRAESFLDDKLREKKKKGYSELDVIANSGTIKVTPDKSSLTEIAKSQIISDNETLKLIEKLSQANIHNILESTTLTFSHNTGLFSTPLGIVTDTSIKEARKILNDMSVYVEKTDFDNKDYIPLLNRYLRLIPQKVGRKLKSDIYPDLDAVKKQNDIIDSLEVSFQQSIVNPNNIDTSNINHPKTFSCELKIITDDDIINRIDKLYKSTLQNIHSSSSLKLKKVYSVKIDSMHNSFENVGLKIGNIMELWHGTKTPHLLSILKNGLIITPSNNPHVCGRMFGDGVYFSDQSTKALNYAHGYWSGTYNNNCFMFLCDIAMGKSYTPKSYSETLPKQGYDSTFAKGGYSGVQNNEMIIYKTSQANLKYLVEFDR